MDSPSDSSRKCSFDCGRVLPLNETFFYRLANGKFTAFCRRCHCARKSGKTRRLRLSVAAKYQMFDADVSQANERELSEHLDAFIGNFDPGGIRENEFTRSIRSVISRFPRMRATTKAEVLRYFAAQICISR